MSLRGARRTYLHHLANDPGERNDLAAERPDKTTHRLPSLKAHVLGELKSAAVESDKAESDGGRGKTGKDNVQSR